jgi:hypothetical protein
MNGTKNHAKENQAHIGRSDTNTAGIWQGFVPTAAMFARDASSVQKTLAEVKNAGFWRH